MDQSEDFFLRDNQAIEQNDALSEKSKRRLNRSKAENTVKAYDAADAVSLTEEPEVGQVLVLADGGSGYAVRIYHKDGMLLEDYAAKDAVLHPEEAQQIGMTEQFEAEKLSGDLLRLKTDAGSVLLHLRSGGDGR